MFAPREESAKCGGQRWVFLFGSRVEQYGMARLRLSARRGVIGRTVRCAAVAGTCHRLTGDGHVDLQVVVMPRCGTREDERGRLDLCTVDQNRPLFSDQARGDQHCRSSKDTPSSLGLTPKMLVSWAASLAKAPVMVTDLMMLSCPGLSTNRLYPPGSRRGIRTPRITHQAGGTRNPMVVRHSRVIYRFPIPPFRDVSKSVP